MTSRQAYITLNLLPHIGPVRVRRLRERFGSPEAILLAKESELKAVDGIGPEAARSVAAARETVSAEAEEKRASALGIRILGFDDAEYPPALKEIYDPPLALYVKGPMPERWPRGVAVVGSRHTSPYGIETAKKLGYQIAYAGVPVVSGLARGIDTAAHLAALAAKGKTWAVFGCGLDQVYPPENQELAERIAETGCLLSEFPLGSVPDRQTFPMRNRIVSGLSFGVLVVEAGLGSGALITARQALEQGRQVFAVPGRIDSPHSKGCHQLIKEGARLVEGVEDVLSELEFLLPPEAVRTPRPLPENLSGEEEKVFAALETEETPIDRVIQKTGLPSATVSSSLLRLEMKKLVRQLPGKLFVRTA
jgi:DNA processing protein